MIIHVTTPADFNKQHLHSRKTCSMDRSTELLHMMLPVTNYLNIINPEVSCASKMD